MGAGGLTKEESQAKANLLIAIAEERKDCIAVISPHRGDVVNVSNSTTQTNNVLEFYAPITSSSYAIFDSGYKYIFDRFNNQFVYVPCNADIAGICVRTELNIAPWVSPAGQIKGGLNNAIKLAYNPTKAQRDLLYGNRINPVVNQRGVGIILFGDKTGLSYSSAFDRINVRKLFLNIEQSIEGTAADQLFEFNDMIQETILLRLLNHSFVVTFRQMVVLLLSRLSVMSQTILQKLLKTISLLLISLYNLPQASTLLL